MKSNITRAAHLLLTAAALTGPAVRIDAQVSIEALQGTSWVSSLTMSTLEQMRFRWKYEGNPITAASWQVTYTAPETSSFPAVVKSVNTAIPFAAGQFATFDIEPSAMPATVPSKFWVRVRSSGGISAWFPVTLTARAGVSSTSDARAAIAPPPTLIPISPPAPPPLIIPGGGIEDTPLWIRMTRFAVAYPVDVSDGDDAYAIVAIVAVNNANPKASAISVMTTPVYEEMKYGSYRSPGMMLWGIPGGLPKPIRYSSDAIIYVSALKHNSAAIFLAKGAIEASLFNAISKLPATLDYEAKQHLSSTIYKIMEDNVRAYLVNQGDVAMGFNGLTQSLVFTDPELKAAKEGNIQKRALEFDTQNGGGRGSYYVRFQLGKIGLDPEPGG